MNVTTEYIAAGGNRHPSAADWEPGLVAFGAGNNIALWDPEDHRQNGVQLLLSGHTDLVNVLKIYDGNENRLILSGSADKSIRIWSGTPDTSTPYKETACLTAHEGSINTISALPDLHLFVSGAADGTVKVWSISDDLDTAGAKLIQSISLKPRYLPLATALIALEDGGVVLAVAGTSSFIQIFVRPSKNAEFQLQAALTGHEGWIRSLDFVREDEDDEASDLLLASASQDKFIRLWRFHVGEQNQSTMTNGTSDPALASVKPSLSNKAHEVQTATSKYNVTFEALLIGHEDWVYTVRWAPQYAKAGPTLLSASADNSLAIWTADEASGVWVCNARLGEISAQKGSTTATGSTGGFWTGLWSLNGQSVVSLGRTGSWRRWNYDTARDMWVQATGISGHTQEVQSLAWSPDGSYLLTTSSDQTTRLFAEWKREGQHSWHEMARPQIHGYDLNCLDTLTPNQFISGADEKLLRVFNKPKAIANLLSTLSGTASTANNDLLPDAANIPVLGLSNKAISTLPDETDPTPTPTTSITTDTDRDAPDPISTPHKSTLSLSHPPFEDHLARHTLWPEHEKLYGHGYEISAVASNPTGTLVATACKASSLEHAVIRLYETQEWREVKPPLTAHSLTVTGLAFSSDGRFLLSVGRDRQWAVFEREDNKVEEGGGGFVLRGREVKGHARMVLGCSWAPGGRDVFATAARDKAVKVWRVAGKEVECVVTIAARAAVTAVAFALEMDEAGGLLLAYATEEGSVELVMLDAESLQQKGSMTLRQVLCPSKAVNALRWRPHAQDDKASTAPTSNITRQLAAVSDDTSVRIFNIRS